MTCNVRIRKLMETVNGVPTLKVSWALVSYAQASEAAAAVRDSSQLNVPEWPDLVVRLVDEKQVEASTGGMSKVVEEKEKGGWRAWMSPKTDEERAKKRQETAEKKAKKAQQKADWAGTKGVIKARMAAEREAEEAPIKAAEDVEDASILEASIAAAVEAQAARESEAQQRAEAIQVLSEAEAAAEGVAEGKAAIASERKAAHAEVMERLRRKHISNPPVACGFSRSLAERLLAITALQAVLKDSEKALVVAKKEVVAAEKAVVSAKKLPANEDAIATAEEQVDTKNELVETKEQEVDDARLEAAPVADEESVAKEEWDGAAQVSKAAAAHAAEAKKARETAERDGAKLLKQGEKQAVCTRARNPPLLVDPRGGV